MALGDAYATAADYRARVARDRDNGDDVAIAEDLLAVSRYLDSRLGRCFNRDDATVARVFEIKDSDQASIEIDDLSAAPAADGVTLDANMDGVYETTLLPANYELLPRNAAVGADPLPYTKLQLMPRTTQSLGPIGARLKIAGKWGWPRCPVGVTIDTIILTSILRIESPWATRRIPEGMDQAVEMSPDAQFILRRLVDSYARRWVFV